MVTIYLYDNQLNFYLDSEKRNHLHKFRLFVMLYIGRPNVGHNLIIEIFN